MDDWDVIVHVTVRYKGKDFLTHTIAQDMYAGLSNEHTNKATSKDLAWKLEQFLETAYKLNGGENGLGASCLYWQDTAV